MYGRGRGLSTADCSRGFLVRSARPLNEGAQRKPGFRRQTRPAGVDGCADVNNTSVVSLDTPFLPLSPRCPFQRRTGLRRIVRAPAPPGFAASVQIAAGAKRDLASDPGTGTDEDSSGWQWWS